MAHSVFAPFYPSLRVNQQLLVRWVIVHMRSEIINVLKKVSRSQQAFASSKLTIEAIEQGVKYVQSCRLG